jgi:beta-galactosidase/beta-glucuronidase
MRLIKNVLFISSLVLIACGEKEAPVSTIDISGQWQFRFDPDGRGEQAGWAFDNSASAWQTITVPGSYNELIRNQLWYQGKAWYRTRISVPDEWRTGHVMLQFLGVALRCKAWVNDQIVGEHLFPYTGFTLDITQALRRNADNWLTVLVDNEIPPQSSPDTNWNGWWNYGGITREVYLHHLPDLYCGDVVITTRAVDNNTWQFGVEFTIQNGGESVMGELSLDIADSSKKTFWRKKLMADLSRGHVRLKAQATLKNVHPWSTDQPNLYFFTVNTKAVNRVKHVKTVRFGFRQIEVKGTRLYLNGKPLLVKGISREESYPGSGNTVSELRTRMDLEDIKALGCNLVRTAHFPQHPRFYDLCDEMGLLVWTEIPAWPLKPTILADSSFWEKYAIPQSQEIVEQLRNHPSLIAWSVGNEIMADQKEGAAFTARGCEYVRKLDPTRLVAPTTDYRENAPGLDTADIFAINESFGWEYGSIYEVGAALDALHLKWPDKPVLVSSMGSGSILGWQNFSPPDYGKDYSEDYQIKYLTTHLDQIYSDSRRNYVAGAILWLYADFPDPSRIGPDHPPIARYINCMGLVTQDRQKKRAFEHVRQFFAEPANEK